MGCFSWMFSDKQNREPLLIGNSAFVITPSNINYFENSYSGYGIFDGKDIYELVVDWNREYLEQIFTARNVSFLHFPSIQFAKAIEISDKKAYDFLSKYVPPTSWYIENWKREVGIRIACYDEDNGTLPFPIKIASTDNYRYKDLPPSNADPGQGFGWY
ncbi:MAG: hypothetical protein Q4B26_18325 [Eubacteriales bacterium]|nr:hypothetical protein [Eubacteriales bacterium]